MEEFSEALSAGIAGVVATLSLYPLDSALVRYQSIIYNKLDEEEDLFLEFDEEKIDDQADDNHLLAAKNSDTSLEKANDQALAALSTLVKELQGKCTRRQIYSGVVLKTLENFVRNFVYFYIYRALKMRYQKTYGSLPSLANIVLATASAVANQCITAPFEVVSTNLQTSKLSFRTVVSYIYNTEGFRGFYRGFGASLILCSNPALTNSIFDRLRESILNISAHGQAKRLTTKQLEGAHLSTLQSFLIGAWAKAIATILTYPYIRAKVLLQAQAMRNFRRELRNSKMSSNSSPDTLKPKANPQSNLLAPQKLNPSNSVPSSLASLEVKSPYQPRDMFRAASFCLSDMGEPIIGLSLCDLHMFDEPPDEPLQSTDSDNNNNSNSTHNKGFLELFVSTVMQDGILGLYRGLGLQLFKTVLAAAILFMVKERIHVTTSKIIHLLILCLRSVSFARRYSHK